MYHEDLLSYFEDAFNFIKDGQEKGNVLVHWLVFKFVCVNSPSCIHNLKNTNNIKDCTKTDILISIQKPFLSSCEAILECQEVLLLSHVS